MDAIVEPPAKKRKQYAGHYQDDWKRIFKGTIAPSKLGDHHAWCVVCSRDVNVSASGVYDVRMPVKSKLHEKNAKLALQHSPMTAFFKAKTETPESTTTAEVMFSYFVAEHNLPTAIADHFCSLVPRMFPDSAIAKTFKCRRTKTTMIVKRCLAVEATGPVIARCQSGLFSVMIDESTDRNTDKRLAVLVRYFDAKTARAHTRLLDMPVCNGGTAQEIFDALDGVLRKREIDWANCVGFASDNCNTMIGIRNSVLSRVRELQPSVFSLGCICHLADLCVKAGMKQLSLPVDDLLINIWFHFDRSAKRRKLFREFQEFANVEELELLKHCQTRWLSLLRVIERVLGQYPALAAYFASHEDDEKPGRVKRVVDRLTNLTTKLTLLFLGFILPVLVDFNKFFQADETKVGVLLPEMDRLLRKLMVKFVPLRFIREQQDLRTVEFTLLDNQHSDDTIAIGMPARAFLATEDLEPAQTAKFFREVRAFYSSVIGKMVAKFPFDSEVLKDLVVMDLTKRADLTYAPIVRLAAQFAPDVDEETLKDEFEDLQLTEDDMISLEVDGQPRRLDAVWGDVIALKTPLGVLRFPLYGRVMAAVLSLPHSNADCERAFSMVRKVHTECRKSLNADTITAFLQCKMNFDATCCNL